MRLWCCQNIKANLSIWKESINKSTCDWDLLLFMGFVVVVVVVLARFDHGAVMFVRGNLNNINID